MKSIFIPIAAMFGYAIANVLIDQKLSKLNNLNIMIIYGAIILCVAFCARLVLKTDIDQTFAFPTGRLLWIAIAVGVIYTVSDYLYIGSYTHGGNLLTITSILSMFPIVASLIRYVFFTKEPPNAWQVGGYVLAFIAILLIAKGNTVKA